MPEETEQFNPVDPLTIGELISLADAAKQSGLTRVFLSELAKKGRLRAKKMGPNYVTTLAAVEEYLTSRHRGKKIS